MKKTAKIALREKSDKDLSAHIQKLKKEVQDNLVKHHLGQIKDTSVFIKLKTEISYCLSLLSVKK